MSDDENITYRTFDTPLVSVGPAPVVPAFFEARIQHERDTHCWNWTGWKSRGYGRVKRSDGRSRQAHVALWEAQEGNVLAEGMVLDHMCRNRACVNPEHLEMVTKKENWRRGESITARNARKKECKRGHTDWKHRKDGTRECRTCKRERR